MPKSEKLANDLSIVFLRLESSQFSRTRTYIESLRNFTYHISEIEVPDKGKVSWFFKHRKQFRGVSLLVVSSPPSLLTILVFFVVNRRPLLDSGWTSFDGVVISRRDYGFLGYRFLKSILIDFFSFHLAKKVLLESASQARLVSKKYFISQKKLEVLYTGVNERRFVKYLNRNINIIKKVQVLRVLFRGGYQTEAGLDVLFGAIRLLENHNDISFTILSNNLRLDFDFPRSVDFNSNHLTDEEIVEYFLEADLVLGQLSNHPRLRRTIPHKFFEAGYFGKAYLTSDFGLMSEFVSSGMVFGFSAGSSESLAQELMWMSANRFELVNRAKVFSDWYQKQASQDVLGSQFANVLNKVLSGD